METTTFTTFNYKASDSNGNVIAREGLTAEELDMQIGNLVCMGYRIDEQSEDTDMVLELCYSLRIRHMESGNADTQARDSLDGIIAAGYEAARVAQLSGDAYSISFDVQRTVKSESEQIMFVVGKSELLANLRDAVKQLEENS